MNRYCTRCGRVTVKQADNLYVCDSGHQNWVNAVPGAAVYVIRDGKVLFGIRSAQPHAGKLNIPGGFMNLSETAEQTAIREVKEEMGINIKLVDILGTYTDDYDGRPTINIVFIAEYVSGHLAPSDDLSGGEPVWRAINDLPTQNEIGWNWYLPAQQDLAAWWHKQASLQ